RDCGTGPADLRRGGGSLLSHSEKYYRRARRTDWTRLAGRCPYAVQRTPREGGAAERGEAYRCREKSLLRVNEVKTVKKVKLLKREESFFLIRVVTLLAFNLLLLNARNLDAQIK